MNDKKSKSKKGDGFCLLPWGESFREGGMVDLSDAEIAVLPVIAAHANKNGEAFPSYDRICAIANVSKTAVHEAIGALVARGWITKTSGQRGVNTHNEYRLCFRYDDGDDSRDWIRLDRELFLSGVWGAMRPSDQAV